MGTFTTAAIVKKELEKIDATLEDADIDNYIQMSEGLLLALLKGDAPASFDVAKHGILREFATTHAALKAATFDTTNFPSTVDAELTINALILRLKMATELLKDSSVRQYLKVS